MQIAFAVVEIAGRSKIPAGITEIPFEIPLQPRQNRVLYETFHGVYININYRLKCDIKRSFLAKDISKEQEFVVEYGIKANRFIYKIVCGSLLNIRYVLGINII